MRSDVTPEQRAAFIEGEHTLGAELHEAYEVPVVTANFYAPHFMTEHGRDQLRTVTGVELSAGIDADTVMRRLGATRILKKWGFLDDNTITRLQMHSKEVWQRVHKDYAFAR